jgi:hypothetical protein
VLGWLVGGGGAMVLLPVVCVVLFVAVSLFLKDVGTSSALIINSPIILPHLSFIALSKFDDG